MRRPDWLEGVALEEINAFTLADSDFDDTAA